MVERVRTFTNITDPIKIDNFLEGSGLGRRGTLRGVDEFAKAYQNQVAAGRSQAEAYEYAKASLLNPHPEPEAHQ